MIKSKPPLVFERKEKGEKESKAHEKKKGDKKEDAKEAKSSKKSSFYANKAAATLAESAFNKGGDDVKGKKTKGFTKVKK